MPHVLALTVELRLPHASSLKAKRSAVRPIVDRIRSRGRLAVAETAHQDDHHRCQLAMVAVAGRPGDAEELVDVGERIVWSAPDVEVLETRRDWMELS